MSTAGSILRVMSLSSSIATMSDWTSSSSSGGRPFEGSEGYAHDCTRPTEPSVCSCRRAIMNSGKSAMGHLRARLGGVRLL
jgi:hypothetical protein